jgi:hypothetical protein
MTTTTPGYSTGRKAKTYYNTGTRLSPTWVEIDGIIKENFDPGEQDFFQAKARDLARDVQEEDSSKPATLTFTRMVKKNWTDTAGTALLASVGYGGTVYEFCVMDDTITNTGATGWKFWGKVSKYPITRDTGAFFEQQWEVKEVVKIVSSTIEGLTTNSGGTAPTTTTTAA